MSEKKQKHKPITFKQIKKSEDNIIKRDEMTFYVKSETDPDREPYWVINSWRKGWLCDCRDFIFGNKECKHIKKVKAL